jgi:hypothetical protein
MIRLALFNVIVLAATISSARAQEMAPPKPGKEHELLKQFEGEWDCTAKFTMAPGQEPMVSKSKESGRIIAGGLFLVFDVDGEMMGSKFAAHSTLGYDTQKKKYTGCWMDSMATGIYLLEGTYDDNAKTLTEVMEGTDPATGKSLKMKMVHELKDKDNRVLKLFMNGPDGKEFQGGTIEYKRKK